MKPNYISKSLSLITVSAIISGMSAFPTSTINAAGSGLKDSGINYSEIVETISNPGMGYTSTVWPVCKPGSTPTYSPTGSLVLFFIDIGAFSSGVNGTKDDDGNYTEGTDYDLDETFFNSWRTTFENCRKNGCMIALRFRYDANGKTNPEPATFEQVLHHIQQIKDSGILEDYKDIIAFVESGFVGAWGEQHSGKYTSVDYKAQVLDAMLDCVPDPIPVTVRTPDIFAKWFGIERSQLADVDYDSLDLSASGYDVRAKRVGLYNDGYMGSNSDLGTYANREIETTWLGKQTLTSYFGGEFSGNLSFAQQYDTYLPENAIPEMYKTHLSYINGNIFQLYKDYTFDNNYSVEGVDNSAYYGQTVFQFIRDHLGYRFVLRQSELSDTVKQGDNLSLHFKVENTGFANPIPKQNAQIILERDGDYMITDIDVNSNEWYSCETAEEAFDLKLPDSFPSGDWNVYLKLSEGNNTIDQFSLRSVQFANEGVWNPSLGANYLGSFTVTEAETHGADNRFYQLGTQPDENSGKVFTVSGHAVADGVLTSPYEWTDDMIIAEDGDNKLWLTSDDEYMYIMTNIDPGVEKPVYNLRVENADTETTYWFYRQSAGWIYYNKGSYDGITLKTNGNIAEFKIAFGDVMGVNAGTKLNFVRIFIQDEGDSWKSVGNIQSGECIVPSNLSIYSSSADIRLNEGDNYRLSVDTVLENAKYQWYLNNEEISGANSETYTISNASQESVGIYSVKVTSEKGVSDTVQIADLLEIVDSSELKGDINVDSKVNTADLVLMQKYLLGSDEISKQGYINGDMNGDGNVNAYDLVQLRKVLIK